MPPRRPWWLLTAGLWWTTLGPALALTAAVGILEPAADLETVLAVLTSLHIVACVAVVGGRV